MDSPLLSFFVFYYHNVSKGTLCADNTPSETAGLVHTPAGTGPNLGPYVDYYPARVDGYIGIMDEVSVDHSTDRTVEGRIEDTKIHHATLVGVCHNRRSLSSLTPSSREAIGRNWKTHSSRYQFDKTLERGTS